MPLAPRAAALAAAVPLVGRGRRSRYGSRWRTIFDIWLRFPVSLLTVDMRLREAALCEREVKMKWLVGLALVLPMVTMIGTTAATAAPARGKQIATCFSLSVLFLKPFCWWGYSPICVRRAACRNGNQMSTGCVAWNPRMCMPNFR